ncbi:MAG: DUF3866 family protein [Bacillota bacterium]|nr:DUF3866 family protein [Bacillota bacterium]MDD3298276.1 DUF3866 family protein [Bacillota bacterium]MDD3851580.1 DUF3866 family protein [Bacillota bacterium]MDD4707805.1 DUF3866 family protein [Bacillota bacterium]
MIRAREGSVIEVLSERKGLQEIRVRNREGDSKALVYADMTGYVRKGDRVILNTTAQFLGLGTGGYHFVIANLNNTAADLSGPGHIMKLRYTPMQVKCLAVEEQQSGYHRIINGFENLKGRPIVTIPLHSMLAPLCAAVKISRPSVKIGYVMTDGAALPITFSKTVAGLKEMGLLDVTITSGNAFGGDMETVNFYTGIIAAVQAAECDLVVVGMGPGIAGTGTAYGFSGVEQGYIIDGINTLGGLPVAMVRISFADGRVRHRGISHHSITVLGKIAKTRSLVPLPRLEAEKMEYIKKQIEDNSIEKKHTIVFNKGEKVFRAIEEYGLMTTTMGRGPEEDRDFFLSIGATADFYLSL